MDGSDQTKNPNLNDLIAKEAVTDAIFASIGDGAIATNAEGKIERINHIALDLLGYEIDEIINQWYPKVIHVEELNGSKINSIELPITQAIILGKPVTKRVVYLKKDGTKLPVSVTVSPTLLEGRPIGAVEVFRDITKDIELENAKSEFISIATHQLKTPPGAILWSLELLEDASIGEINDQQKEVIQSSIEVAKKMIDTVNSLLNVSRLELGTFIVEPVPTNYVEVAKEVLVEQKQLIEQKKLKIKEDFDDIPLIPSDPGLAKIVVENLISNAVKYTRPEGNIFISIKNLPNAATKSILITVKDNGFGIPLKQQDKIFLKMFRADNVKTEVEGTGLGLYLLKSIVEFTKGKVWFESKENIGTTFYIELPVHGMVKKEGTSSLKTGVV